MLCRRIEILGRVKTRRLIIADEYLLLDISSILGKYFRLRRSGCVHLRKKKKKKEKKEKMLNNLCMVDSN